MSVLYREKYSIGLTLKCDVTAGLAGMRRLRKELLNKPADSPSAAKPHNSTGLNVRAEQDAEKLDLPNKFVRKMPQGLKAAMILLNLRHD
jgi:hypothetical protein